MVLVHGNYQVWIAARERFWVLAALPIFGTMWMAIGSLTRISGTSRTKTALRTEGLRT